MKAYDHSSSDRTQHALIGALLALVLVATVFVSYQISKADDCRDEDICVGEGTVLTEAQYSALKAEEAAVLASEGEELAAMMTPIGGGTNGFAPAALHGAAPTANGPGGSNGSTGNNGGPGGSNGSTGNNGGPGSSTGNTGNNGGPGGSNGSTGNNGGPGGSNGSTGNNGGPGGSNGSTGNNGGPGGSNGSTAGNNGGPGGSNGYSSSESSITPTMQSSYWSSYQMK